MADGQQPPFQLEFSSGRGLLDARALWAGTVGPHRMAMGMRRSVILRNDRTVEVAKNLGAANAYLFVGVALPFDAPVVPTFVFFGSEEQLGKNTGSPFALQPQMGNILGFTQILLPGEQLYGQIVPTGPATQQIVVAEVTF